MRKVLLATFLLLLFPSFALAQSTPSVIISLSPKQATPVGLANEKRVKSINSLMALIRTAFMRTDKIDQKIATRLVKISSLGHATASAQAFAQINSQQKEIANTLEALKKDLNQLELQSQSFSAVTPSKSDFLLFKGQIKKFMKSLNNVRKQEIDLTNSLKKLSIASDTPRLKTIPLQ